LQDECLVDEAEVAGIVNPSGDRLLLAGLGLRDSLDDRQEQTSAALLLHGSSVGEDADRASLGVVVIDLVDE